MTYGPTTPPPPPPPPSTGSSSLVTRAMNILTKPATEWRVIDGEATTVGRLITGYALILAAIAPLAMLLGMFVLGFALSAPLELVGVDVSSWDTEAPELLLLGMAFTMTVPMVAWMRHRGHEWARSWEMAAAMFLPSCAAIGLLWTDVETDIHALLEIQHVTMFPGMLLVMLLRRHEYTGH